MPLKIPPQSALPTELCEYDQWVCWRREERNGKETKIPIDPQTGRFASTTDSETWSTSQHALAYAQDGQASGVGFVFTDGDPFVGVDLDDCRTPETGESESWAEEILDELDSYTEVSPSGTGYHVLVRGSLSSSRNRRGSVECYETGRFFTVTGEHVDGTPQRIEARPDALSSVITAHLTPQTQSDGNTESEESEATQGERRNTEIQDEIAASSLTDSELIERAKAAANSEKFSRLWRGETTGYDSHSEADMALCALLAFWSGGDGGQMDRLFRQSGLHREKWDAVHYGDGSTYGEKTIERAIAGTNEYYEPAQTESSRGSSHPSQASTTNEGAGPSAVVLQRELRRVKAREAERIETIQQLEQTVRKLERENERLCNAQSIHESDQRTDPGDHSDSRTVNNSSGFWQQLKRWFSRK